MKLSNLTRFSALALIIFLSNSVSAQDLLEPCASGSIHSEEILNNPKYARSMFYLEQKIEMYNHGLIERSDVVYTIPVVVHVIHLGEAIGSGTNISDEQVFSAIEALNDDYRKIAGTNGDGEGVDVEIEFCLASRDPFDNSTTGIVRVDGTVVPDYETQGIEANSVLGADEEDVKALSTWPREDYVNIWVVSEIEDNDAGGGTQGYAYFPIDSPVDGIVVLHNAFGTVGNLKPNTDENRTLTHEMGHVFALYHTFHSTNDCSPESNCETQGDRVCDTPITILNVSCSSPACDNQQVENYMDYTSEICKDMFTQGQKDRMRGTLETDRLSLTTSMGCIPVSENDAGITDISHPNGTICSSSFQPIVKLANFGSNTLTSLTIEYGVNGNTNYSYEWSGSLTTGMTTDIVLPTMSSTTGDQTITVQSSNPNGSADDISSNDSATNDFTVSTGVPLVLEVTLDFFGTETTWDVSDENGDVITSGGPYVDNNQGLIMSENICAASGCYDLTIYDDWGDGMSFTNGSYSLLDADGSILVSGGGDFGDFETTNFCFTQTEAEGQAPVGQFSASDNSICEGQNIDFLDTSVESPTEWNWTFSGGSPSSSSNQNPQNVYYYNSGTYEVSLTVTNDFGSNTYTSEITVGDQPSINLTGTDPTCSSSNNGSINSVITCDDSYSVSWSNGNTTEDINNLGGGSYTATVTSSEGCSAQSTEILNAPAQITVNLNSSNISCNGLEDGSIITTVNNAQGTIDYSWSNGSDTQNMDNLSSGNYTLTVTDASGCSGSSSATIDEPGELELNLLSTNIACGTDFGFGSVNPVGGNSPYSTNWSNGQSGNNSGDLSEGSYSVSVMDNEGCTVTESFNIVSTENLVVSLITEDISCNSLSDGSITANASGGTGDYNYNWSNGAISQEINGLESGSYSVEVIDSNGCSGGASQAINEPSAISFEIYGNDISCFGLTDGNAEVLAEGGTGSLLIEWSNGSTASFIDNLAAGTYAASITDDNGCEESGNVFITQPSELSIDVQMTQPETCTGGDGAAHALASGGNSDFDYIWSDGTIGQDIMEKSYGIYEVTATNSNGCSIEGSVLIEYDCDIEVPTTTLIEEDCGRENLYISDFLTCYEVDGAEAYQWRFTNLDAGIQGEIYTLGNNNTCQLNDVDDIYYEISILVSVRILSNGVWSEFGDICEVYMADETPSTEVSNNFCEQYEYEIGDVIYANAVLNAEQYEWILISDADSIHFDSYIPFITLVNGVGLENNTEYEIQVRCKIGPFWSDYGDSCEILVTDGVGIPEFSSTDESLDFYPNPFNGNKINVQLSNISSNTHVSRFELFNSTGKLIETFELSELHNSTDRITLSFNEALSPGVYIMRYHMGSIVKEEKLIVR